MVKPTVGQAEELDLLLKESSDDQKMTAMRNVLDRLGLPLNFTKDMAMDDFTKVVEFITGAFQEKKS